MQKVYARNLVPKGNYRCGECDALQELSQKEYLMPCPECGSELFRAWIVMTLTPEEIQEKFYESLTVLAIASYLYETHDMSAFLNVIAINLRMLLCDGDGSLLPRVIEDPLFFPTKGEYEQNVILPQFLFEPGRPPISLEEFLEQVIIRRPGSRPVTIKKMIRAVANQYGGAHVDTEIHEDYYLSSQVSKHYFIQIAKYLINLTELDYNKVVEDFVNKIKEVPL